MIEARPEQIEYVTTGRVAEMVSLMLPIVHLWESTAVEDLDQIKNSLQSGAYCKALLSGLRSEEFWVVCLNTQNKVIGKKRISQGTVSATNVYPRAILETALMYNATHILLTHNHPGGTLEPSVDDVKSTILIKKLLDAVGIILLDHIIVANDMTYSMIVHNDIDYRFAKL